MSTNIITLGDPDSFQAGSVGRNQKLLSQRQAAPAQRWLKSHQVRRLLTISPGTLQHLRVNGALPYTKIGGRPLLRCGGYRKNVTGGKTKYETSGRKKTIRKPMKNGTKNCLKWKAQNPPPCSFVQGARCTNVNTFGFLPSLPAGFSGK